MGKPTFIALLTLIEDQLDQDPWLGYQTLLELLDFVKADPAYQSYVAMLESLERSYSTRIQPKLLTPLPITKYYQEPLQIRFDVGRLPTTNMDLFVQGQPLQPIQRSPEVLFSIAYEDLLPLPIQLRVNEHTVANVELTFISPVKVDDLGI
jgi:hypothetical protein